ncbi:MULTISPECIES: SDR family NAD(P)-dependent oxidoreductase [unclassified Streptomyces]|uniref:SDR family NAD(P)-dependent oxidoreductase n=1 Tax=unclassified Streptomyces TaxID=2593676 RepID=UPI0004BDA592|nr:MULTISPECIES: SDR family oxidoreductase [unclassified Streptomyces]
MPTALVTGATAGLGKAFTRALAEQGHDLVLVARSERDLKEHADLLHAGHGVRTEVLAADLTTDEGCARVTARLAAEPAVDLLVNNAGIGYENAFGETGIHAEERLLDLNVRAVLRLTDAALRQMTRRRSGAVLNVASVAGLGPAWLSSTYPASKAWIIGFTESLAASHQVRAAGVRMTALLPGYTRTEFHQRAGIPTTFPPPWLWLNADDVVRAALRDLDRGKVLSIPSLRYKTAAWGLRHLPRSLSRRFAWDISRPGH